MFKWLSDSCTIHNFKYIWLQHDCTILYIYHICWWERSDNRIIEYDPLYFSYPKKHHKLNIFYIEIAIMHYVNFSCHWCMVDVGRIIRKKLPCGSVAFQRWQWWVVSIPPPSLPKFTDTGWLGSHAGQYQPPLSSRHQSNNVQPINKIMWRWRNSM